MSANSFSVFHSTTNPHIPDDLSHTPTEILNEAHHLDLLSLDTILDRLTAADRELIWLHFAYRRPTMYKGTWPPGIHDIGRYIGTRFGTHSLRPRTIRERTQFAIQAARTLARCTPSRVTDRESVLVSTPRRTVAPVNRRASLDSRRCRRPGSRSRDPVAIPVDTGERHTPIPGANNTNYLALLKQYTIWIDRFARRLARGDRDLYDDLGQVAHITLWEIDHTARQSETPRTDAYIRGGLVRAMFGILRHQRRVAEIMRRIRALDVDQPELTPRWTTPGRRITPSVHREPRTMPRPRLLPRRTQRPNRL